MRWPPDRTNVSVRGGSMSETQRFVFPVVGGRHKGHPSPVADARHEGLETAPQSGGHPSRGGSVPPERRPATSCSCTIRTYLYIYIYMYMCSTKHMRVYTYIYIYIHIYYIHIYMCVCTDPHIYIYIYIYVYIYICICIYTCV